MREMIDIKEIKIADKDNELFIKVGKTEYAYREEIEHLIEQIQQKHEELWKKMIKKYNLKKDIRYRWNRKKKAIIQYEEEEDDINKKLQELVLETLVKELSKNKGIDLCVYGIDMVRSI